jgi:molecular chaperone GrpE
MTDKRDKEDGGGQGVADEPSGGKIEPSEELAEAMREAAEAVKGRRAPRRKSRRAGAEADEVAAPEPGAGPEQAPSPEGAPRPEPAAEPAGAEAESAEASPQEELERTKEHLMRLAADFENFRRRALKDHQEAYQFGHQNLVKDLLPTVDNLQRAIDHAAQSEGGGLQGLLQGVELVLRELQGVFAKHGVTAIEAADRPFDPEVHEAMAQAPDASVPPNTVVQVFQRGYRLRDRLLRPARVVVSCPPENAEAEDKAED